jgi:hypothetical protein
MSYLQRYLAGDHEAVWQELGGLDPEACGPDIVADAEAVARVTMERVAVNIDRLIERLAARNYVFGVYPDGEAVPGFHAPRTRPHAGMMPEALALYEQVGPLPLSLRAFWHIVGEVNLVGRAPDDALPAYSDPLSVDGPSLELVVPADDPESGEETGSFYWIAPDVLHKDNVSGGEPYAIRLPDTGFDAPLLDEWHATTFVAYLRIAILEWGGFPGLSEQNPHHEWRREQVAAPWVKDLGNDLVAF